MLRTPAIAQRGCLGHGATERNESGLAGGASTVNHMRNGTEAGAASSTEPTGGHRCVTTEPRESVAGTSRVDEGHYRALFENMDQGFCVIEVLFDAAGDPVDYRFLEVNPAFEQQTGLHDAVGKRMRELAPAHEEHWFAIYGQVARTGQPVRFVNEAKALGDRWFDVNAFRLGGEGSRTVAVLFTDVSARKRAERTQQDFVAMASHDLATPVTVLRARAQLMQRRQEYDEAAIEAIIEQTTRMERLIADLRDLVRLETGQIELRRVAVDLRDLARESAERVRVQATAHAVRIETPRDPVRGEWDPDRLGQVLDNLLGNAVKYSRSGSDIVVRVMACGAEARIAVTDRGEGIPAEALPRLFERFYRADRGEEAPGLGIGLYISRMLVEAHGGRIWAESAPGQGSTFTVALPCEEDA